MLMIRLKRVGRKNDPSFRIVVIDRRWSAKAGRAVEILGFYNPRQKALNLEEERVKYWLSQGAKPSDTVHNILVSKNVLTEAKVDVSAKSKKKKEGGKVETPAETKQEEKKENTTSETKDEEKPEPKEKSA